VSAADWLAERKPQPPDELRAALTAAVKGAGEGTPDVAAQLVAATASLAPRVVADGCGDRSGALDLLALDALMTYAMEAGSATAAECEQTAENLLSIIRSEAARL
jgi:hypothetical protein